MTGPQKLMLIRHGEKPQKPVPGGVDEDGVSDKHSLAPQGWQRAGALVRFFSAAYRHGIAKPDSIFAAGVSAASGNTDDDEAAEDYNAPDDSKSRRSEQTVMPLSRKLKIDPNTTVSVGSEDELVKLLRKESGTVLVAWEHKRLEDITTAFVGESPKWDGKRFDLVWVLDRQPGDTYGLTVVSQDVLDGDNAADDGAQ